MNLFVSNSELENYWKINSVWVIVLIFVLFVLLPIGFIWSEIKLIYNNFRFRKSAVIVINKIVEVKKIVLLPKYESIANSCRYLNLEIQGAKRCMAKLQAHRSGMILNFIVNMKSW